ncbi:arsenite oxidase large subunit (plasmid) [Acidiphilium multivorum AIU301]|uniref:Arsenite oxidase large subunit n=1 Tax=Acidiphilium multivorum (strain DSM 11245 / JCM 8867 / NBRC 100883 / AIU 301) TaxID=926570 RepID=F0J7N2_ACIMA|nr:arsenite oxidase large subunit [Acidiphilium multivorum AIU301]
MPPGTVFALMYHWLGTSNSLTSPYTDPMSTNPWYKGTRVGIRKLSGGLASVVATTSYRQTNTFT